VRYVSTSSPPDPNPPAPWSVSFHVIRSLGRIAAWLTVFGTLLFAAAGRWDWTRGWIYVGLAAASLLVNLACVLVWNPELLRARFEERPDLQPFDRLFVRLYIPAALCALVVASVDAGRYGASAPPALAAAAGVLLHAGGIGLITWAMVENPHLEVTVRIQSERSHQVVTTGPYGYVRHPMYSGLLLAYGGAPLILGSWYAYAPIAAVWCLLVWRTVCEDRMLQEALAGYADYAGRTRYRLFPGLW
jgi:protein-S-isoprenylcysteine O-methyltransferase Ste14